MSGPLLPVCSLGALAPGSLLCGRGCGSQFKNPAPLQRHEEVCTHGGETRRSQPPPRVTDRYYQPPIVQQLGVPGAGVRIKRSSSLVDSMKRP